MSGTALKPAWEPVIVARKPLEGTVAQNVLKYGTGAMNIDASRVGTDDSYSYGRKGGSPIHGGGENVSVPASSHPSGRWPANLIHDGSEEVLAGFPQAPGQMADVSATAPSEKTSNVYGRMHRDGEASANSDNEGAIGFKMKPGARRLDSGSAARFFYCAKASKKERDAGCEGLELRPSYMVENGSKTAAASNGVRYDRTTVQHNNHPTVKPVALMRYLCKLVTQPGGTVLDPFMGSGSTGIAAKQEGFNFIGIEKEAEYVEIAKRRIGESETQTRMGL